MRKYKLFTGVGLIALALIASAEEETKIKVNQNAIPPTITPEDAKLNLTKQEHLILLNSKKSDFILKNVKVGGKLLPSQYEKRVEKLQREQFDADPRQTIPLKDCIKPNSVIDNDVQECMNGRMIKNW
jgi:hypothetical protein